MWVCPQTVEDLNIMLKLQQHPKKNMLHRRPEIPSKTLAILKPILPQWSHGPAAKLARPSETKAMMNACGSRSKDHCWNLHIRNDCSFFIFFKAQNGRGVVHFGHFAPFVSHKLSPVLFFVTLRSPLRGLVTPFRHWWGPMEEWGFAAGDEVELRCLSDRPLRGGRSDVLAKSTVLFFGLFCLWFCLVSLKKMLCSYLYLSHLFFNTDSHVHPPYWSLCEWFHGVTLKAKTPGS